jgi:hypothetical protein
MNRVFKAVHSSLFAKGVVVDWTPAISALEEGRREASKGLVVIKKLWDRAGGRGGRRCNYGGRSDGL